MNYLIKYEISPLRALYNFSVRAKNADEAVALFRKEKPHAIIRSIRVDAQKVI